MSLSDFFRRSSVAIAASASLLTGGAFLGNEAGKKIDAAPVSQQTLFQHEKTGSFLDLRDKPAAEDPAHRQIFRDFHNDIKMIAQIPETNAEEKQRKADDFIVRLRMAERLTEADYKYLTEKFDRHAGISPSYELGNYRTGAAFQQECIVINGMLDMLSFGTDARDQETSKDIGECMAEGAQKDEERTDAKVYKGEAAAGGFLAGLFSIPFWRRRRHPLPKLR